MHCGYHVCWVPVGVLNRHSTGTHRVLFGGIPLPGTVRRETPTRAVPPAGSSARALMTECVVAGAGAAHDGAARAAPAADAGGHRRWAARGARGGANVAAVGAASDGLRGDREPLALNVGRPCYRPGPGPSTLASNTTSPWPQAQFNYKFKLGRGHTTRGTYNLRHLRQLRVEHCRPTT